MNTLLDIFNNIKTQTCNQIYTNMINFGYHMCYNIFSVSSQVEILYKNSIFNQIVTSVFYKMTTKYVFQFIKNGKCIQTQYNYYKVYLNPNKFDFIIFSAGNNCRIINNIHQDIVFNKDPVTCIHHPIQNLWFSATLEYSIDNTIYTLPIEFNTNKYNYLLPENVFDNLFIEYFIKTHYNIQLQNIEYSIIILNHNFKIETYNKNTVISLQNILKKKM